jgi:hypothetical protein
VGSTPTGASKKPAFIAGFFMHLHDFCRESAALFLESEGPFLRDAFSRDICLSEAHFMQFIAKKWFSVDESEFITE